MSRQTKHTTVGEFRILAMNRFSGLLQEHTIRLRIDLQGLATEYGRKAVHNTNHRSILAGGKVLVEVVR